MRLKTTLLSFFLTIGLTAALAPAMAEALSGHKNTQTWNGPGDETSNPAVFYDVYRVKGVAA